MIALRDLLIGDELRYSCGGKDEILIVTSIRPSTNKSNSMEIVVFNKTTGYSELLTDSPQDYIFRFVKEINRNYRDLGI